MDKRDELVIERLQQILNESGTSKAELARVSNKTPQAVNNWFKNGKIGIDSASLICKKYGYSVNWLLGISSNKNIESNVKEKGIIEPWDSNTPLNEDDLEVPFYKDIHLAAGNGFSDDIADYNNFKIRFSKATLKRQGVQYENAVCVVADGNSMEPVIPDGTTVGIDLGNKTIKDGKIYAINHGGLLRIKMLYNLPNQQVKIRSYNDVEHEDEIVDMAEISIIGKVFWYSVLL